MVRRNTVDAVRIWRRRKEEGGRRKEEGGRRKEEGGRRKEEGGRRKVFLFV